MVKRCFLCYTNILAFMSIFKPKEKGVLFYGTGAGTQARAGVA